MRHLCYWIGFSRTQIRCHEPVHCIEKREIESAQNAGQRKRGKGNQKWRREGRNLREKDLGGDEVRTVRESSILGGQTGYVYSTAYREAIPEKAKLAGTGNSQVLVLQELKHEPALSSQHIGGYSCK